MMSLGLMTFYIVCDQSSEHRRSNRRFRAHCRRFLFARDVPAGNSIHYGIRSRSSCIARVAVAMDRVPVAAFFGVNLHGTGPQWPLYELGLAFLCTFACRRHIASRNSLPCSASLELDARFGFLIASQTVDSIIFGSGNRLHRGYHVVGMK